MTLTQPTGMELVDWADQVSLELGAPRLQNELDWQGWGAGIALAVPNIDVPSPYQFDNWTNWAERFCQTA